MIDSGPVFNSFYKFGLKERGRLNHTEDVLGVHVCARRKITKRRARNFLADKMGCETQGGLCHYLKKMGGFMNNKVSYSGFLHPQHVGLPIWHLTHGRQTTTQINPDSFFWAPKKGIYRYPLSKTDSCSNPEAYKHPHIKQLAR